MYQDVCSVVPVRVPSPLVGPVDVGEPELHRQRGKWVVRVTGYDSATGRRRVRQLGTFDTKRAAVAHQKAAAAGRAGGSIDTLADFLESVWLPAKEGRVETSTFDQYRWAVTRHIVPLIGAVRLADLRSEVVDAWLAQISVAPDGGKPRLGATSSRLVRKVLSMAMEEAVQVVLRHRCPRPRWPAEPGLA
jgi:hypothetical protein